MEVSVVLRGIQLFGTFVYNIYYIWFRTVIVLLLPINAN